jgi:hypothetical protein
VHLGPRVGFGRLMTNNLRSNLVLIVLVVYDIQKDNTNNQINFYMGYNEEIGKSHEDSLELRIFNFI